MLSHNLASLQNLWIQKCCKLKSLSMSLSIQHLTSLKSLEIRGCKEIDLFSDDGMQCVSVITLQSLSNFKSSLLDYITSLQIQPICFCYFGQVLQLFLYFLCNKKNNLFFPCMPTSLSSILMFVVDLICRYFQSTIQTTKRVQRSHGRIA